MPTTVTIFQDRFDCPHISSAKRLLSYFQSLPHRAEFICKRCQRRACISIAQLSEVFGDGAFQANESDGVPSDSEHADWWSHLHTIHGYPFTGWACGECASILIDNRRRARVSQ
jgi:hypothetical protein